MRLRRLHLGIAVVRRLVPLQFGNSLAQFPVALDQVLDEGNRFGRFGLRWLRGVRVEFVEVEGAGKIDGFPLPF